MFYEQLQNACKLKGIKLTPLLKEMGISTGNTGRWKQGGTPSVEVLNSLSVRLDVSTDYLLGYTNDPTPSDKKKSPLNDLKEGVRQELIKRGKITPDKELSDKDWDAILSVAETFANRSDD